MKHLNKIVLLGLVLFAAYQIDAMKGIETANPRVAQEVRFDIKINNKTNKNFLIQQDVGRGAETIGDVKANSIFTLTNIQIKPHISGGESDDVRFSVQDPQHMTSYDLQIGSSLDPRFSSERGIYASAYAIPSRGQRIQQDYKELDVELAKGAVTILITLIINKDGTAEIDLNALQGPALP